MEMQPSYPASLDIDYSEQHNRLTTLFRIFTVIPIFIIMVLLVNGGAGWDGDSSGWSFRSGAAGIVFLPLVLMLLFRKKYPRWWFDWNLALTRFVTRVEAYLALLRDEYPSTDEEQAVHLEIAYPDVESELMRGMPLIKWFLDIPHYVVLFFLSIAALVCIIIAWFAILFTGSYPRSLFDFVVGVMRWYIRVLAYAFILTTDRYPPFSLS